MTLGNKHSLKVFFNLDNSITETRDPVIANRKYYLKNTCVIATGLSDFYKLATVSLKSHVVKTPPETTLYTNYKNFDVDDFNKA